MLTIKTLKQEQLELLFTYATLEGWNVEESHIRSQQKVYNKDFFIAYKGTQLVGFIIAIKHKDNFGFISTFIVLKKYRLKGYGRKILEHAIKHLDGCQIALNSVVNKESIYEKFGFKSYFSVNTYKFIVGSVTLKKSHIHTIDLDTKLSLKNQDRYMRYLLSDKGTVYKAIKAKNDISSFAFMTKYSDGYKIVIKSNNMDEIIVLFFKLIENLKEKTPIYLESTKLEPLTQTLVKLLKMRIYLSYTRMYNKILNKV